MRGTSLAFPVMEKLGAGAIAHVVEQVLGELALREAVDILERHVDAVGGHDVSALHAKVEFAGAVRAMGGVVVDDHGGIAELVENWAGHRAGFAHAARCYVRKAALAGRRAAARSPRRAGWRGRWRGTRVSRAPADRWRTRDAA